MEIDRQYIRNESVLTTSLNEEIGFMDMDNGHYYASNKTGKIIWDTLESKCSISELVDQLKDTFEVDEEECKKEVIDFLVSLMKKGLIIEV